MALFRYIEPFHCTSTTPPSVNSPFLKKIQNKMAKKSFIPALVQEKEIYFYILILRPEQESAAFCYDWQQSIY